jgi:hypothetical protein
LIKQLFENLATEKKSKSRICRKLKRKTNKKESGVGQNKKHQTDPFQWNSQEWVSLLENQDNGYRIQVWMDQSIEGRLNP